MSDERAGSNGPSPPGGVADIVPQADDSTQELAIEELEEVSRPAARKAAANTPPSPPRSSSSSSRATTDAGGRRNTSDGPTAEPGPSAEARASHRTSAPEDVAEQATVSAPRLETRCAPASKAIVVSSPTPVGADDGSRLRQLCEAQLEREADPARKARLHYELARLHESELHDPRKAAEHYQLALRHAPDHVAAIRGARRMLAALGEHAALPALFDAEIAVTREPTARARLLALKAEVYERILRQPGAALATYREALALDPGNVQILKGIERGHRRNEDWPALAQTYLDLASAVSDASLRAAWIAMAAHLTETRLANPAHAAALYESALALDPHAAPALAHVKRLGTAQGRWPSLLLALRKELELCGDADARRGILTAIAHVYEKHLGDVPSAIAAIEEALRIRSDDRALLHELARLETAIGRAPVASLARLAELTRDPDELATLCHRIGRIFEQDLQDVDRARVWYERALGTDATHRGAFLALVAIYETREDWQELLRILAQRAHAIPSASERAELFHRMGHLLEEKLAQPTDAAAQHAHALGLDPSHDGAFRALARLYTSAGEWRKLAELYTRAIERAPHDAEAIAWLFRLGGVLEDRLGDLDGALAAYTRILDRDPSNLGALHAIARTAERAGRFDRVVDALRAEAQLTTDPVRRDSLLHRAATITADALGDVSAAMIALEQILATTPQHRPSLESLAELATKTGQWARAVAVQSRILPLLPSPKDQARLYLRIGEIQAVQLGNDTAAVQSFTRALSLDPDLEPAREARIAALERLDAYLDLASAHEERLARITDPEARARAATELGALYEEKLNDTARALASYERAIESVPLHRPALDARERLLTGAREVARLAHALQAEAAQTEDEFERVQAALRAALAMTEEMGAAALGAFRPVFAARPGHVGALLAVENVYGQAGDDAGLAATYERLAEAVTDPNVKLAVLAELRNARAASGGDANAVHHHVLALAPNDPRALEELAAVAEQAGDADTELAMRARLAAVAPDGGVAAYHHCRIAEILLARNDATGALAACRAALAADPQNLGATDALARAAKAARDPAAMRDAARYETLVTRDRSAAVALLRTAAQIFFENDREDDAAACYAEALSLAPDDPVAAMGLMATMTRGSLVPHLVELLQRTAEAATDPSRAASLHLASALYAALFLQDLPAAIAATRRALAARPEHLAALASLATYLERNAQWLEAAETLERLIARTTGPARVDAHLRLARIAERHLRDYDRAAHHLRTVLANDENDADALTALVRLERVKGNDEEALRLARKLITIVRDEEHRAAALAEMAELEHKRGELDEAAKAAHGAMSVSGPSGSAARLYRTLIASAPQHASWEDYTSALLSYLERAKAKGGDLAAGYRELARVLTEAPPPQRLDRAIAALREGTRVLPLDTSIGLALVGALRQANSDAEALAELRRIAAGDVLAAGVWRTMADVLTRMGVPDGASTALAPLVVLGQATEDEARIVRARPVRPASAPTAILAESGLKRLSDSNALDEGAAAFFPGFIEVITKIEGIEYERWGVNKRDRIRAGDPHPLRALADRIGRIFGGVPEYDLFAGVTTVQRPFIVAGNPPALLVPASLESAREPVLAFHLARPLALLSRLLHPLDHIDDATMERILVAGVRQFQPRFKLDPTLDETEIEAEVRRIKNAVGFFSRGRIQEAAAALAAAPPASFAAWAREIRRLAARAALLVSDDLLSTLEALGEPLGPDNYASDLARFWVGDRAMRFRRAITQQP